MKLIISILLTAVMLGGNAIATDEYYWKVRGKKMTSPHYQLDCHVPRKMASGNIKHRFEMRIQFDQSSPLNLGKDDWKYVGVFRDDDKVGRSTSMARNITNSSRRFDASSSSHPVFTHDWIKYITGGTNLRIMGRGSDQPGWTHLITIRSPSKPASSKFLRNCGMANLDAPAGKSLGPASKVDAIYEEESSKVPPNPSANGGIGNELGWSQFGKHAISNHFGKVSSTNAWFISCQDSPKFRQTISVKRNDIRGQQFDAFQNLEMRITNSSATYKMTGLLNGRPGHGYVADDAMLVLVDQHVRQMQNMMELLSTGDDIKLEFRNNNRWHLFHSISAIPKDVANDLLERCKQPKMRTAAKPQPAISKPEPITQKPSTSGGTKDDTYDPLEDPNIILVAPTEPPAPPVIIRTKVKTIQERFNISIPTATKQSLESNLDYILNDTCKYVTQSPAFIDANQELAMQCAQLWLMIK